MKTASEINENNKHSFLKLTRIKNTMSLQKFIEETERIDAQTVFQEPAPEWYFEMMKAQSEALQEISNQRAHENAQRFIVTFSDDLPADCIKYKEKGITATEKEHMTALETNFFNSFDEIPDANEMHSAVRFIYLFLAEILECYPTSAHGNAAGKLKELIDEDNFVNTCRKIAQLQKH